MYTRYPRLQSRARTLLTLFPALAGVALLVSIHVFSPARYLARAPSERAAPATKLSTRPDWTFARAPPFCAALVARPVASTRCVRDARTHLCAGGGAELFGQFGQDHYVFTRHFARLARRGVYVDAAANHATDISNSFFMDACLGWDGLCVEANPEYHAALRTKRSCALEAACVSDRAGQRVSFIAARGAGGVAATNKHVLLRRQGRSSGSVLRETARLNLTCTTLGRALERRGVAVVDYLSLDVEGHELNVLRGVDWDRVRVNVMTVEANHAMARRIETFLRAKGYKRHYPVVDGRRAKGLRGDIIFLHGSVVFGKPV